MYHVVQRCFVLVYRRADRLKTQLVDLYLYVHMLTSSGPSYNLNHQFIITLLSHYF
jgi:hypothetical protein